jgi:uncharacterized phage-associated protein
LPNIFSLLQTIMHNSFTSQQINKLGNTLVYLANNVGELNKTKILKLLYLIEEKSIKKFGYPFFGFDFQLWKFGPVLKDIYIDLSEEAPQILAAYITRADYDNKLFIPITEFIDDEFSDNDMYLLNTIVDFAKHKTASDLVDVTHTENSLWKLSALKNGIYEQLEAKELNSTEFLIDFSLLFDNNTFQKERYESAVDNLQFINHFKR